MRNALPFRRLLARCDLRASEPAGRPEVVLSRVPRSFRTEHDADKHAGNQAHAETDGK